MADVPADGSVLRTQVPEGIFTLSIEDDNAAAASRHAAFAERCLPLLMRAVSDDAEEVAWPRAELTGQLGTLRQEIGASRLGYLGALAGERDGRPVLILLGIAATPQVGPGGLDPASLLAAMLRRKYPGSAVEEFATADRAGLASAGALVRPALAHPDQSFGLGRSAWYVVCAPLRAVTSLCRVCESGTAGRQRARGRARGAGAAGVRIQIPACQPAWERRQPPVNIQRPGGRARRGHNA
jgi:hypothetical protein